MLQLFSWAVIIVISGFVSLAIIRVGNSNIKSRKDFESNYNIEHIVQNQLVVGFDEASITEMKSKLLVDSPSIDEK